MTITVRGCNLCQGDAVADTLATLHDAGWAVEMHDDGVPAEDRRVRDLEALRDYGLGDDLRTQTVEEFLATPDEEHDWIVPGLLERGDRLVLTGHEGLGKALALDTPVPTPKGWATMGLLSVGDEVFGPDGRAARITFATEVMHNRSCYRVRFSDGAEIVADADHLWRTETLKAREAAARYKRQHFPKIVTTAEIAETLTARGGHTVNHGIDVCAPLAYPAQELLIAPYVLGAWLGDGHGKGNRLTCYPDDTEIIDRIRSTGLTVRHKGGYSWSMGDGNYPGMDRTVTITAQLRALGVLGDKHIPETYLRASVDQRLTLLQGLMDTDGTVGTGAAPICEFSVCSGVLAHGVLDLLQGLGIKVKISGGPAKMKGQRVGTRWRLAFQTDLPVFHLRRKAERLAPLRTRRAKLRYITSVETIASVPVRCIQVDHPDRMYLAGRGCIPTHNTTLFRQLAVCMAAGVHPFTQAAATPRRVLFIDCENAAAHTRRHLRPLVAQARLAGHPIEASNLWLEMRPEGLDLATDRDTSWLLRRVTLTRPDVVCIGPLYRLAPRALNSDDEAAPVLAALNMIRARGSCVLLEAHAGHAASPGGKRDLRPRGSSALLGWPEFGYGIRLTDTRDAKHRRIVEFSAWRGDRDHRSWPEQLEAGGAWPWVETVSGFDPRPFGVDN